VISAQDAIRNVFIIVSLLVAVRHSTNYATKRPETVEVPDGRPA
jgi:hypothetical protein